MAFSLDESTAGVGPVLLLVFQVVFPVYRAEVLPDTIQCIYSVLYIHLFKNTLLVEKCMKIRKHNGHSHAATRINCLPPSIPPYPPQHLLIFKAHLTASSFKHLLHVANY